MTKDECAKCKICCSFDSYDLWETPVITDEIYQRVLELKPEQKFSDASGTRLFVMEREPDRDLYYCPMLDHKSGCMLKDEKPFDCRIWPLRIMRFEGRRVIVISPVCPTMFSKPLKDLKAVAKKLAPVIFSEADLEPDIVKPYIIGYPILVTEDDHGESYEDNC